MRTSYGSNKRLQQQHELPVELIGEILSRLEVARYVIRASATCRKWREAFCKHLHALSFNINDDERIYRHFSSEVLEMMITFVIFKTSGLRKLSILMDDKHVFTASTVVNWLLSKGETLRELILKVKTDPNINLLYVCERVKLEALRLSHYTITHVGRFTCLTSLSLMNVSVSIQDLNSLLMVCRKIESLELIDLEYPAKRAGRTVKIDSPALKSIFVDSPALKSIFVSKLIGVSLILETNSITSLHIKNCSFDRFKFIGSGSLKRFIISDSFTENLDIGETDNLETFELYESIACWLALVPRILESPNLKRLGLWIFVMRGWNEVSFEKMAVLPQLSSLSILYNQGIYAMEGSSHLKNVIVLEIGWISLNDGFWQWIEKVLKRCPNLKKLIILATVSLFKNRESFCELLAKHEESMIEIVRSYRHLAVQLKYK